MKNIVILGSTGSIGKSTLEIVKGNKSRLAIKALTASTNWELLVAQALEFNPEFVAIADPAYEGNLIQGLAGSGIRVGSGPEAVIEAVTLNDTDVVVAAIVGFAGFLPVMEAISRKLCVCLANKETLVVGGSLVMSAAADAGVSIIPIDSEHSAIFQCLQGAGKARPSKLIITASGGPFRTFSRERLADVTLEEALKHPNWSMGAKITIDSATLMNKGLEVIEAHWMFGVSYDDIEVLVHPQSIVHSLVEFSDSSVIAQLGWPDMRIPIQYALSWPERWQPPLSRLNLAEVAQMNFEAPRINDFPCLSLAFKAGKTGGIIPCVLNAANEVAVSLFMQKKITFIQIPQLIDSVMGQFTPAAVKNIDQLLEIDTQARLCALEQKLD